MYTYDNFIMDFVYDAIVSPATCDIIPREKSPIFERMFLVSFHTGSGLILSSKSCPCKVSSFIYAISKFTPLFSELNILLYNDLLLI